MTYTCSVCGDSYEEDIPVDADNHVGGTEVRNAVTGNCGEAGYTGDTYCLGCNTKIADGKVIPATENHDYGDWIVITLPTISEYGIEERQCSVCDKKESRSVDPLSYMSGDVNLDGRITAADSRIILRASAKLEQLSDSQLIIADIDANGKVTASDACIVLRISAKLDSIDNYIKNEYTVAPINNFLVRKP